jgi:hypothetical protein
MVTTVLSSSSSSVKLLLVADEDVSTNKRDDDDDAGVDSFCCLVAIGVVKARHAIMLLHTEKIHIAIDT